MHIYPIQYIKILVCNICNETIVFQYNGMVQCDIMRRWSFSVKSISIKKLKERIVNSSQRP